MSGRPHTIRCLPQLSKDDWFESICKKTDGAVQPFRTENGARAESDRFTKVLDAVQLNKMRIAYEGYKPEFTEFR